MTSLQLMMRRVRWIALTGSMLGAMLACAEDDEAQADGAEVETIDEFFNTSAQVLCARRFDCCPESQAFDSQAQCEVGIAGFAGIVSRPINDGRARFNGAEAADCLESIRLDAARSCESGPIRFECPGMVEGLQKNGEVCGEMRDGFTISEPVVCQRGLVCAVVNGGDGLPRCQPPIALGESCAAAPEGCGADAFCAARGQPDAACAPRVDLGEECQTSDACADDAECSFDEGVCVFLEAESSMMCDG